MCVYSTTRSLLPLPVRVSWKLTGHTFFLVVSFFFFFVSIDFHCKKKELAIISLMMFVFGCEQKLTAKIASFFFLRLIKLLSLGTRLRPSGKKMRPEKRRPCSVRKILRLAQKRFFEPCRISNFEPDWLIDWNFYWKPNRLGVPSYRESHVSGKGVPKSRKINIGMPQRRRQRVPHVQRFVGEKQYMYCEHAIAAMPVIIIVEVGWLLSSSLLAAAIISISMEEWIAL